MASPTINLNDSLPAAPSNGVNVKWQAVASVHDATIENVTAYVPGDGNTAHFLRGDMTLTTPPTMGASGGSHSAGYAPDPGSTSGTTRFLREDATWAVPSSGAGGLSSLTGYRQTRWVIAGDSGVDVVGETAGTVGGVQTAYVAPGANIGASVELGSASSGTSAFGYASNSSRLNYRTGQNINALGIFAIGYTTNIRAWFALVSVPSSLQTIDDPTASSLKVAGFRFSTVAGDTHWQAITSDGTTNTIVDTGITPDTNGHKFLIVFQDSTPDVLFYIDGTLVATITTHLPASGVNLGYNVTAQRPASATESGLVSFSAFVGQTDL